MSCLPPSILPCTYSKGSNHRFNPTWLDKYPWLYYDKLSLYEQYEDWLDTPREVKISLLILWYIDTLVHWFIVTLVHLYIDLLVHWFIGTLVYWCIGLLVHWYIGLLVFLHICILFNAINTLIQWQTGV